MRKISFLLLNVTLFFSCNKLKDYLPNPHSPLPQFNKVYGGSHNDEATTIIVSKDGSYLFAGSTSSNDGDVSGNHGGQSDTWIMKVDKHGNKQWQQALGGSELDDARAIIRNKDGGYVMAGYTTSADGDISSSHGDGEAWIVTLEEH